MNANTGQLVWEALANTGVSSSPTVSNGIVYISGDDLFIHALHAATGSLVWKKPLFANSASAAVSDQVVYVGGGGTGYFYAFDARTRSEQWKFAVGQQGFSTSNPLIIRSSGETDYSGASGLMN